MKLVLYILLLTAILLIPIGSLLYWKFGWFKSYYHDKLHMHVPVDKGEVSKRGYLRWSTCKHCGAMICQDIGGGRWS